MARPIVVLALLSWIGLAANATAQTSESNADSLGRMAKYFSNVPVGNPAHTTPPAMVNPYVAQRLDTPRPSATAPVSFKEPVAGKTPTAPLPVKTEDSQAPPLPKAAAEPKPMPLPDLGVGQPKTAPTPVQQPTPIAKPESKPAEKQGAGPFVIENPAEVPKAPPATPPPTKQPVVKPPVTKQPPAEKPAPTASPKKAPPTKLPVPKAPKPTKVPVAPPLPLPTDPAYTDVPPPVPQPPVAKPPVIATDEGLLGVPPDQILTEGLSYYEPGAPRRRPGGLLSGRLPLGIEARGWIDQGVTINTQSPRNRRNFPVTFNDRSNAYQMNQLYMILERAIDLEVNHIQLGGRVDLLYGTDHVYTTALGLETSRDGAPKWNSANGPVGTNYGLAMPQAYLEAFAPIGGGLSVKMGHFYTIMGYEVVPAPDNFFYSHAYTMQYGEPFTHTGLLAEYTVNSRWKLQAGVTRGWDTWEDNNNGLAFLGGLVWTSEDEKTSLALSVHTGPEASEPPARGNYRTTYSLVFQHQLNDRLTYVLQHDQGYEPRATIANRTGHWYGINQYLLYRINPIWAAGLRIEWFHDKNGFRLGTPDGGDYYELTAGLNWTPRERLTVRPEIRWDWAKTSVDPLAGGTLDHQLLVGVDMIVTF